VAAVLQRPTVPGRRVCDRKLRVLGGHQRGGRGAGQRLHRGGAARTAGGLGQHLAAELPGLGAQGGPAPAAPGGRCPRQAAPSTARDVLLPAGERPRDRDAPQPEAVRGYCALPGPRQRLGLSGHRVRPREGKPPAARGLQVHASGWPGDQAARTGDKAMLATAHVFRSDQLAELDLKRLANNGTRLCLDGLNWQNACAWEWRAGGGR
jgi:hypothetical protein